MSLCTVAETARRLKLSESAVRTAIRVGTIPAIRLGRRVRIAQETLDALERIGHPSLTKPQKVEVTQS
jgi:excisionase family DNA binding protein